MPEQHIYLRLAENLTQEKKTLLSKQQNISEEQCVHCFNWGIYWFTNRRIDKLNQICFREKLKTDWEMRELFELTGRLAQKSTFKNLQYSSLVRIYTFRSQSIGTAKSILLFLQCSEDICVWAQYDIKKWHKEMEELTEGRTPLKPTTWRNCTTIQEKHYKRRMQ